WFHVHVFNYSFFHPALPFSFDRFPISFSRIGKRPPVVFVWYIFNRVTEEFCELVIDHFIFMLRSTSDDHSDWRAQHQFFAVLLAPSPSLSLPDQREKKNRFREQQNKPANDVPLV